MMDFTGPMRDLVSVDSTEPAERVQTWRRVLMGVYNAGFGAGYAANESDASVRAALSYTGIRFTAAPSSAPDVPPHVTIEAGHQEECTAETPCASYPFCSKGEGERPAVGTDANGNGRPLDPTSTLTH